MTKVFNITCQKKIQDIWRFNKSMITHILKVLKDLTVKSENKKYIIKQKIWSIKKGLSEF